MNSGRILLALACLGSPLGLTAQSQLADLSFAGDTSPSLGDVRKELDNLVLTDAKARAAMTPPQVTAAQAAQKADDVVSMDPYVVRNKQIPTVDLPVFETPLYRFIKTGTVVHRPMDLDGFKTDMRIFALAERGGGGAGRLSLAFNFVW